MDNSTDHSLFGILRILVLIQGAIGVTAALQVLAMGALLGAPLGFLILAGFADAALTLALAAGVTRRSRRARRVLVTLEVLWLVAAAVDLALSLILARRAFALVPLLTRIVLPYFIFRMLRRPAVRREFGLGPTRRQRRKYPPPTHDPETVAPVAPDPVLEMA